MLTLSCCVLIVREANFPPFSGVHAWKQLKFSKCLTVSTWALWQTLKGVLTVNTCLLSGLQVLCLEKDSGPLCQTGTKWLPRWDTLLPFKGEFVTEIPMKTNMNMPKEYTKAQLVMLCSSNINQTLMFLSKSDKQDLFCFLARWQNRAIPFCVCVLWNAAAARAWIEPGLWIICHAPKTVAVHVTPFTVLLPFMFTANISGGKLIHGAAPTFWVGNPSLGVIPDEDFDWKLVNTDF